MRIFVSGQIGDKEAVRRLYRRLQGAGYSITHDWTNTDDIGDKLANAREAGYRAELDLQGVIDCDVYVIMTDNERAGKGMYVELGAALASNRLNAAARKLYAVGALNHLSIFYLHPEIISVGDTDELMERLKIDADNLSPVQ